MASMDYENENGGRYDGMNHAPHLHSTPMLVLTHRRVDEAPRYERDRSASPRPTRRNDSPRGGARRSASPNGNGRMDVDNR